MQEIILRKDKEWNFIDGELCLISEFMPLMGSKVENGEVASPVRDMPYASIEIICRKTSEKITGFVTHKLDFANLWSVFKERGIKENEEILMYWTRKHYGNPISRLLSLAMPKMIVMVCKKGTYESCTTGFSLTPNNKVMAHVYGLMPVEWRVPDVIK